jgi:hypothetical protein
MPGTQIYIFYYAEEEMLENSQFGGDYNIEIMYNHPFYSTTKGVDSYFIMVCLLSTEPSLL